MLTAERSAETNCLSFHTWFWSRSLISSEQHISLSTALSFEHTYVSSSHSLIDSLGSIETQGHSISYTWSKTNVETRIQCSNSINYLARLILHFFFIACQHSTGHLTRQDNSEMLVAFTKPFVVLDIIFYENYKIKLLYNDTSGEYNEQIGWQEQQVLMK